MTVSSTSEILYYRDKLAEQAGADTWYIDKLYTENGESLATNYDPISKKYFYYKN